MDDELERFKREINLVDVAFRYGFSLAREDDHPTSKTLRIGKKGSPGRQKIGVLLKNGVQIYVNWLGDESDKGTVIDFVQNREPGLNLGQVRKILREFLPGGQSQHQQRRTTAPTVASLQEPAPKDHSVILAAWEEMQEYSGQYLLDRGLNPDLIAAFRVRQDSRNNACFPHYDEAGLTGYEVKNQAFTGFCTGGSKALMMMSIDDVPTSRIVITEASIDALSYAQLKYKPGDLYISTSGTPSARQLELIEIVLKNNPGSVIINAQDADDAGDKLAAGIASLAPPGARIVRDRPAAIGDDKDWNDVLKRSLKPAPERIPVLKATISYPRRNA